VNLVDTIRNQIPASAIRQLSQVVGKSDSTTRSAVAATVPSLLFSFSRMASTESGMQMLQGALEKFNPKMLNGTAEAVSVQGVETAESLLGPAEISPLVDALTRSFGIGSFGSRRLVGFLTATVLGGIARQFAGRTISPEALTLLFAGQRRAITKAVPQGFPGAESPLRTGVDRWKETARYFTSSRRDSGRWTIPLAIGLAVILMVMLLNRPRNPYPGRAERTDEDAVTRVMNDLRGTVQSLTGTLGRIKDEESAEAALPAIVEARSRLDEIRARAADLPAPQRERVDQRLHSHLVGVEEQSRRVEAIPGAGEKLKQPLEEVTARLSSRLDQPVETPKEVR